MFSKPIPHNVVPVTVSEEPDPITDEFDEPDSVPADLGASIFGTMPSLGRQVSVDTSNPQAVQEVRKYGLYHYLLTHDLKESTYSRELILAQLDFLDTINA